MQNDKQGYAQGIWGQSGFSGQFSAQTCVFRQEGKGSEKENKEGDEEAPGAVSEVRQSRLGEGPPPSVSLHGVVSAGAMSCCLIPARLGEKTVCTFLVNK